MAGKKGAKWVKRTNNISKVNTSTRFEIVKSKVLTLVELRELYKMYQADCNIQTIALYMRITKEYALECIEAAKWLYTGQLHRLKQRRLDIFRASIRPPEKFFKDDKRGEYKRPPAEYTNQRPYDFDK